jgi:hypothetical protein
MKYRDGFPVKALAHGTPAPLYLLSSSAHCGRASKMTHGLKRPGRDPVGEVCYVTSRDAVRVTSNGFCTGVTRQGSLVEHMQLNISNSAVGEDHLEGLCGVGYLLFLA